MLTQSQPDVAESYLNVNQAARRLSVHPSTIRRWIDQGRLPAYRLGEKRIALKQSDLARVVSARDPRHRKEGDMSRAGQLSVRSLTDAERTRGLEALAALERRSQEMFQRRGREPSSPSWLLLDEAREERTRDLTGEP